MTRCINIYKNKIVISKYPSENRYYDKDEKILEVEISLNSSLNDVFMYKLKLDKLNSINKHIKINFKDDNKFSKEKCLDCANVPINLSIEIDLRDIPENDDYTLTPASLTNILELYINWSYFMNYRTKCKIHYVDLRKLIELKDENFKNEWWFIELYKKCCYKGELIEQLYSLTYDELYSICKCNLNDNIDNDDIFIKMEEKYPEMKNMFKDKDRNKMIDIIELNSSNLLKYIISSMTLNCDYNLKL